MKRVRVATDLVLDERMYETATAAMREHAPQAPDMPPLTWAAFTARPNWLLVPDTNRPELEFYKAELEWFRSPEMTLKVNVWKAPDLRRDGRPAPHSHPWRFRSYILDGAYVDVAYTISGGRVDVEAREHSAGGTNDMPLHMFHEVTQVHGPTLTLMVCGPPAANWGYLDPDTGVRTSNMADPDRQAFRRLLAARNPHLRMAS